MPMRRGVKFVPVEVEPEQRDIMGIPVEVNEYAIYPAQANGFWFNRKIVVGKKWLTYEPRMRQAVLLHEARHCIAWHREKRVLWFLILLSPLLLLPLKLIIAIAAFAGLFALIENRFAAQELEADRFAVDQGYGVELLRNLQYEGAADMPFYPTFEKRCLAIRKRIKDAFRLGITANEGTVSGKRQSLGYFQFTPSASAQLLFTPTSLVTAGIIIPPGVTIGYMIVQNNVAASSIRWRDDGVAPTAAIGMVLGVGELDYTGEFYKFQVIISVGSPILDVSLYA